MDPALRTEHGAAARGQHGRAAHRLAPLRDAIGITGQDRAAEVASLGATRRPRRRRDAEPRSRRGPRSRARPAARAAAACCQSSSADSRSEVVAADRAGRQCRSDSSAHACAHSRAPPRRDEHPRQPRMQRQSAASVAELGQLSACRSAPRRSSRRDRGVERFVARPLEPLERPRIAAPRHHVEHRADKIDAVDLRLAVRPQPIARHPTAAARAPGRARPARPAR